MSFDPTLFNRLQDPTRDGVLSNFIIEFENLQQALRKSRDSEARFLAKSRELKRQITDATERLGQIMHDELNETDRESALEAFLAQTRANRVEAEKTTTNQRAAIVSLREQLQST
jgi:predicted transcriptional regulator